MLQQFLRPVHTERKRKFSSVFAPNGAFTLNDFDSAKVSDSDNISVHSCEAQIRIENKIEIGIGYLSACSH